jgi:hypothetical protein
VAGSAGEQQSLSRALNIQGARAVSVVALDSGAMIWSRSTRDHLDRGGNDDVLGAGLADMVAAAARVVGHTELGSGLDDLVLSSLSWFHVLRLTGDQQVVHLLLDRGTANLSLARRELKTLVVPPLPQREATQAIEPPAVPTNGPANGTVPEHLTHDPMRLQGGMNIPDWLSQLADEPFDADTPTLERVLAGLRGFN